MVEERHRQPLDRPRIVGRSGDAMYIRDPTVIGPAHQQVANIYDKGVGIGRHVDPRTTPRLHLQPARHVLTVEDGEKPVIRVLAAPELARPGRLLHVGIEVEPHRRDMTVDLVVEEMLREPEPQGRNAHEVADKHFHLRVVAGSCLPKTLRTLWPDVGYEIAPAFAAGEVRLVGPALAAEVVVLLEIRRRHVGVAVTQGLVPDRLVATGRLDVDRHHLLLLFDRQGKKLVRLAVEAPDHIRRHTVACDGKKPDLAADAINLYTRAQARGRIAG